MAQNHNLLLNLIFIKTKFWMKSVKTITIRGNNSSDSLWSVCIVLLITKYLSCYWFNSSDISLRNLSKKSFAWNNIKLCKRTSKRILKTHERPTHERPTHLISLKLNLSNLNQTIGPFF